MRMLWVRCCVLVLVALTAPVQTLRAEEPVPTVDQIRQMLGWLEPTDPEPARLAKLGDSAFPAYEAILSDPKSLSIHVIRAIDMISGVKSNRSRFLDSASQRLNDPSFDVRAAALELLAEIGSERDTAPIIALLSDDHARVRRTAAKTLGKIGGKRDLVALDIWLTIENNPKDAILSKLVQQSRDVVDKRLKDKISNPVKN